MKQRTRPCLVAGLVLFAIASVSSVLAQDAAELNQHKALASVKATLHDGKVLVTFNRDGHYADPKYNPLFQKLRIYRKLIPFTFGNDKWEALRNLTRSDQDVIYEGSIRQDGQQFTYIDDTAAIGNVYAYWAGPVQGAATGSSSVKVRDPQVWWTAERIATEAAALHKDFPDLVDVEVIGKTHEERNLLGITAGRGSKRLALIGALHAGESGPELILHIIRQLLSKHPELFDDVSIVAIACVNQDRRQAQAEGVAPYLRTNPKGIDLNRNYPADWEIPSYLYGGDSSKPGGSTYRGPEAASEPETKAVIAFLEAHRPMVLLSYHHVASVSGRCLWGPQLAAGDEAYVERCRRVYDAFTEGYKSVEGPVENEKDSYLVFKAMPGSLPNYCYRQLDIPGFDVESHWVASLEPSLTDHTTIELLNENRAMHEAAILNLLQLLR
ncbi:MAG: hypothetical protein IT445_07060 [Phycisphaeraceae bacterium]|nr:hypothetical protein [Phycisphaeraceae bacterium]